MRFVLIFFILLICQHFDFMMDGLSDDGLIITAIQQCSDIKFSSSSDDSEDDYNEYEYVAQFKSK